MPDSIRPGVERSSDNLPAFYADADRSRTPCRIVGCDSARVRGVSVCPRHEHMYDTGDWPQGMEGWRAFLAAAGGDGDA
jgi:hypothetical protein